ncbi:40S ribosomal protein S11 [Myotis brandtii]|uniref:Small ribosomal subunit protein uS17 n=2 Tax=Boreoeutheria TaxID=1437010 RepID=S7NHG5_MYOBR|nr:40S ribosomal protein S11 [Myotis brandtii]
MADIQVRARALLGLRGVSGRAGPRAPVGELIPGAPDLPGANSGRGRVSALSALVPPQSWGLRTGKSCTLDEQWIRTERAYQKQPTIFQNKKRVLLGETGKEKLPRYYKNIGLGFKTPKEAIEGTYIDKKCPFTGNVSIRGRILSGVVTKMKMQRTIVIRRDYLHYIRKYNRFEKRHKNMSVHLSPCFRDVQIGDIVTVGECRPLSKTVRFNVLKVTKAAGTKKQFQKF